MTYCANDVQATFEVIQKVYPMFEERYYSSFFLIQINKTVL